MAIHAYDEMYLGDAQNVLGHSFDFALMTLNLDADLYGEAFAVADVSKQFAAGNPKYVAGVNGCELARVVLEQTHLRYEDAEDVMYLDKSPEYWGGWMLAYYQWLCGRPFSEILKAVPFSKVTAMYDTYHERDVRQAADRMEEMVRAAFPQTKLRMRRETCGMSQSELAAEASVPLRQIQLFEQRQRNINKTAADTLLRLSRALSCRMEDLMEK